MFKEDGNGRISYRGVMLDEIYLNDQFDDVYYFILPKKYIQDIDARDIPDIGNDDVYCLLPGVKSVVSSKSPNNYIRVVEVNEYGVTLLIKLSTNEIHWNEPISPAMFFTEIQAIFGNNDNLELHYCYLSPQEFQYTLEYTFEVPSFNLKEIYDTANNLLIEVEEEVYKKILQEAIGNLRAVRKNYKI
ncbi:hypothetical protein [Robertmurraya sp. FSL R5-0851]|uniref:hypothetical protein n=1 Tax=Robertmurraya sp. FSL R5-0851 TaxID=2921584 RepID=UPI0030F68119